VLLEGAAAEAGGVEPEVLAVAGGGGHQLVQARCDHVAGCQVAEGVDPGHHRPAVVVAQGRAGAAQRLGDERARSARTRRPQHGRVELDELDVAQHGPGPGGEGEAVAGDAGGVGRGRVGVTETTRGEHDCPCGHVTHLEVTTVFAHPGDVDADDPSVPVVVASEVEGERARPQAEPPPVEEAAEGGAQHTVDLGARGVAAGVHDPVPGVPPFEAERSGVEAGPELPQASDLARRRVHQGLDGVDGAQAGTCAERVGGMQLLAVGGVEHGGEPPLRPGRRTTAQLGLGDHQHVGTAGRRFQGGAEPGSAGADHHDVRPVAEAGCCRRQ